MNEVTHGEATAGEFAQRLIGAHIGDFLRHLVVGQDVQSRSGQSALEKGLELREHLVQNVGQLHKLA